jgi:4-diphosphocytidyl-2-C-methyl-D-erythritol kinase
VLAALGAEKASKFSAMSGSGATCFALFESLAEAQAAETRLRQVFKSYWIRAGRVKTGQ